MNKNKTTHPLIVGLDVDNTCGHHGVEQLCAPLEQVLDRIHATGHHIFPITGRPWVGVGGMFEGRSRGAVCGNGTALIQPGQPTVYYDFADEQETAEALMSLAKSFHRNDVFLIRSGYDRTAPGHIHPKVSWHEISVPAHAEVSLNRMRLRPPVLRQHHDLRQVQETACRFAFFYPPEMGETVNLAVRALVGHLGNTIYHYPKEYVVEVCPRGRHKAATLAEVMATFRLGAEDLMVCGDSWNDEEALRLAKYRVVMEHAPPPILGLATHVVDNWNQGLGLAQFLQHFFFGR